MSQSSGARHLDVEGTWNLRDLGGYPTIDGRTTRWRTLYRGDALSGLPAESLKTLSDLEIKTVIDLRRTEEREFAPSDFASSQRIVYMPIDLVEDAAITGQIDYSSPEYTDHTRLFRNKTDVDRQSYKDILDMRRHAVAKTIRGLAAPGALPAVFHCGIGKDRTGLVAALVLALARVSLKTISEDYALSSRHLVDVYIERQASPEEVASGYDWKDFQREYCPQDTMLAMLRYLEEKYNGVEPYLLGAGLAQGHLKTFRKTIVE